MDLSSIPLRHESKVDLVRLVVQRAIENFSCEFDRLLLDLKMRTAPDPRSRQVSKAALYFDVFCFHSDELNFDSGVIKTQPPGTTFFARDKERCREVTVVGPSNINGSFIWPNVQATQRLVQVPVKHVYRIDYLVGLCHHKSVFENESFLLISQDSY